VDERRVRWATKVAGRATTKSSAGEEQAPGSPRVSPHALGSEIVQDNGCTDVAVCNNQLSVSGGLQALPAWQICNLPRAPIHASRETGRQIPLVTKLVSSPSKLIWRLAVLWNCFFTLIVAGGSW